MVSVFKKLNICFLFYLALSLLFHKEGIALDKKTSYTISHYIMAVMYDDLGDVDKAVQEYKKALKADRQNSVIHLNLAIAYIKKSNLDKAIDELRMVIKLDPEAVEPHAIMALLYSLQNKTEESNGEYEIALTNASKLHPKNIDIYKNLGSLYLQQKKLQVAEGMYKLILEISPTDASARFYLADIYDQSGDKNKAEEELKKALELKPDYHEALNYLGYLYVEENKYLDKAEIMIKKALEMEPNNGAYVDSLGWFYFKEGKFDEAVKLLTRASTLLEDPIVYDHLGDAYFKIGDREHAKINWQNSLKLSPKQEKVKNKIEDLDKETTTQEKISSTK